MAVDASDFLRRSGEFMQRQLPQIEVWALNKTGDDALSALQDRMKVSFDRPTRWTLNAFQVWRATKSTRLAMVQERPSVGRRHYLKVQESGGPRQQTALEKLIEARVVSAEILRAVVPTRDARVDSYGNWSRGERNQALSEIGAQRDRAANATETSIKRARRRGRSSYFVPRNGGLTPGIWKRTVGGDLSKVATFAKRAPLYAPRLKFEDTVAATYRDRLEPNLKWAFERAVQTMR
ncbi:hypothetical protein OKW52_20390 [Pararhodobacter zhoushanensis]|uniref:Uncharacterized protein n=2 Tax=Pararhodobacter zhoushanensis TaxID=2479545 RepID=A0ABT3H444_9RHOB|nr:hypothetical protein [Pararhodobacter zhoushanensis]MCW1934547.1 hypothetical protein [Pararhodobacter zhoushanensis]